MKFTKKINLKIIFSIFFALNFSLGKLSALTPNEKNTVDQDQIENTLDIEYLKKIPKNDYIIGSGDTINIIISREYSELTSKVTVDGEGTIYLPKLHRIYVENLSINELNELLDKAFKKFIKYPSVETEVLTYRPIQVIVEGELVNPGVKTLEGSFKITSNNTGKSENALIMSEPAGNEFNFPFEDNNDLNFGLSPIARSNESNNKSDKVNYYFPTVFDAIRSAGGLTPFSDLSNITVIRRNTQSDGGGLIKTQLDFENQKYFADDKQNIRIYDGDIIRVSKSTIRRPEIIAKAIESNLNSKYIKVSVTGRVNRPGRLTITRASTIDDAINMAGGSKILKGPLKFVRFNNDGTIDRREIDYKPNREPGSYKNPFLKDNDFIYVGNSFLSSANEVINEVTSPFVGVFSTYGLIKAVQE